MRLENTAIAIIGGTGFIGRYLVRELARTGALIRVASRDPQRGLELRTAGYVGQVALEKCALQDKDSVARAVKDMDIVINLAGILFEHGTQRFAGVQAQGAERLAKAAKEAGVKRLVHISALGVDSATGSKYARSKLAGEKAVLAAFPGATILRPSIVFGAEDQFFNRFAQMAMLSPLMPLIGGGRTQFQPVYVMDVARAIRACLEDDGTAGKLFELGGPAHYSFREVLDYIMAQTGHRRPYLPIPFGIAAAMGALAEWLPNPPLTYDQVQLLKHNNVTANNALPHLGIAPTAIEPVVPEYMARYRKGGRFAIHRPV